MGITFKDSSTKDLLWTQIHGLVNYFKLDINKS